MAERSDSDVATTRGTRVGLNTLAVRTWGERTGANRPLSVPVVRATTVRGAQRR